MARPNKQGIDYFPYDVDLDQDDKLGMIIAEYGERGERLFVKLLCWIYQREGYFMLMDEETHLKFLRRFAYCDFTLDFIKMVVPRMVRWELFNKQKFDCYFTITSERIQRTWLDASRKRKDRVIYKDLWLLDIPDGVETEETRFPAEETILTSGNNEQSKVK